MILFPYYEGASESITQIYNNWHRVRGKTAPPFELVEVDFPSHIFKYPAPEGTKCLAARRGDRVVNAEDFLWHPDIFAITWKNNNHTDVEVYHPSLCGVFLVQADSYQGDVLNMYMLGACLALGAGAFQEFTTTPFLGIFFPGRVDLPTLDQTIDNTLQILTQNLRGLEFNDVKTQLEVINQTRNCAFQALGYVSQEEEEEEEDDEEDDEEEDPTPVRNKSRRRRVLAERRERAAQLFDINLFTAPPVKSSRLTPIPEHIHQKLRDVLAFMPSLCHAMISLTSQSDHPLNNGVGMHLALESWDDFADVLEQLTPTPEKD